MTMQVFVDGWAAWASGDARPAPQRLSANERRRASEGMLAALHVAEAACTMAGADPAALASVFTSAHGDLAIVDALARTLATDPALLSPTRFHHSVHNAISGYWGIAAGSRAPSTALAAGPCSFAAGWLEAACQVPADARPVLLVGLDTAAPGPLAGVHPARETVARALVLSPVRTPVSRARVDTSVMPGHGAAPEGNPMRAADTLWVALIGSEPVSVSLGSGSQTILLTVQPLHAVGA